ncbi:MAG: SRPBCC domain-containing protein [Bacteroidetes bacterium]|nr:SRPBCC domain-containing protein [Bacteroidota bacterium]
MKDFKKYYYLPAPPEEVYAALTNPVSIKLWTGEDAVMDTVPNSEFSLWNDSIIGKNLEFEENKKIVQHWYFGDQEPASIVTIKLHADKDGTSVEVRHTNIPDESYEDMAEGWDGAYMASLQEFFD